MYEACKELNLKSAAVVAIPDEIGSQQEMAVANRFRLLGRQFHSNRLALDAENTYNAATLAIGRSLIDVLLENDSRGVMYSAISRCLKNFANRTGYSMFNPLVKDMEYRRKNKKVRMIGVCLLYCSILFSKLLLLCDQSRLLKNGRFARF